MFIIISFFLIPLWRLNLLQSPAPRDEIREREREIGCEQSRQNMHRQGKSKETVERLEQTGQATLVLIFNRSTITDGFNTYQEQPG
jgi:hypothetical protein